VTTGSVTTSSIANNATDSTHRMGIGTSGFIASLTGDSTRDAWLTIYASSAALAADSGRTQGGVSLAAPVAGQAYQDPTAGQTIAAEATLPLQFGSQTFGFGGIFWSSGTNTRLTAPVAGQYVVNFNVVGTGTSLSGTVLAKIYVNGFDYGAEFNGAVLGSAEGIVNGSVVLNLSQNDFIEVWLTSQAANTMTISGWLSMVMAGSNLTDIVPKGSGVLFEGFIGANAVVPLGPLANYCDLDASGSGPICRVKNVGGSTGAITLTATVTKLVA